MAKEHLSYFTVNDSEYTEIGEDLYLVLGGWAGLAALVYNPKTQPRLSELPVRYLLKCGNGYYFICFTGFQSETNAQKPQLSFLGINTQGSFLKYFLWLFSYHKMECPIDLVKLLAEEESQNIRKLPRKYPDIALLSEVCKYTWSLQHAAQENKHTSYYATKSAYNLIPPNGELAKEDPRNHFLIQTLETPPPVCVVEQKLKPWIKILNN